MCGSPPPLINTPSSKRETFPKPNPHSFNSEQTLSELTVPSSTVHHICQGINSPVSTHHPHHRRHLPRCRSLLSWWLLWLLCRWQHLPQSAPTVSIHRSTLLGLMLIRAVMVARSPTIQGGHGNSGGNYIRETLTEVKARNPDADATLASEGVFKREPLTGGSGNKGPGHF